MISWIEILLLVLKIIDWSLGKVDQDKWIKAGADAEIAKTALAIANKTAAGRAIMEKVNALSDADVDTELGNLGA